MPTASGHRGGGCSVRWRFIQHDLTLLRRAGCPRAAVFHHMCKDRLAGQQARRVWARAGRRAAGRAQGGERGHGEEQPPQPSVCDCRVWRDVIRAAQHMLTRLSQLAPLAAY
eukprot:257138-Chlamydomonas_euryale.AAC.4